MQKRNRLADTENKWVFTSGEKERARRQDTGKGLKQVKTNIYKIYKLQRLYKITLYNTENIFNIL